MDVNSLLLPISDESVCGENLSFSPEFDAILALQQEDDPTLDQGDWIAPLKVADWRSVQDQCALLLTQRTKDLRLAMWWAEACTRNVGYPGLLQGLTLCEQLSVRFWDHVHPLPEHGDQEERAGNINWFLRRVAALASLCPVTHGRSGSYHLQDLMLARKLTVEQAQADTVLTLDRFGKALKDTPRESVEQTLQTLEQCLEALARWQSWVDTQLGERRPNFVPAREGLERACHEVRRLGTEIGLWKGDQQAPVAESAPQPVVEGPTPVQALAPRAIQSPEEALALLREVAAYFRATQPHSPVAYLADKAAQWGEMPLHDWLRAVVKDGGTLLSLQELLGVSQKPD